MQRFFQAIARRLRLGQTLVASQIHEAELGAHQCPLHHVVLLHLDDHNEVRTRGSIVHLSRASCPILHPSTHQRREFLRRPHSFLHHVSHVHLAFIGQLHLMLQLLLPEACLCLEQVTYGLVVNLHQCHLEVVAVGTPRLLGDLEDLCEGAVRDPWVVPGPFHRVCLAAASLPIREHTHVEPIHDALDQRLHVGEYLLLGVGGMEHTVVLEQLLPRRDILLGSVAILQPNEAARAVVRRVHHRALRALVQFSLTQRPDAAKHPDVAFGGEQLVEKPALLAYQRADLEIALGHRRLEHVTLLHGLPQLCANL
mmetsp:Transcript_263/g.604  ORF Transcript_263/g.604 Transcript_263/m.604 type:complete len:311 (+) Transcript_263:258-1190(+)